MPDGPWVGRDFDSPHVALRCDCGWTGTDAEIDDWDVQFDRDRVVRKCPNCDEPVAEWGTLRPIDGAVRIARGPLRKALADAGFISG